MRREEFLTLVQPRLFVGGEDVDLRQFRANQIEVVASLDISFVDVYGIVGVEVDGPKDMGLRRYGIDGRAIVAVRDDESVFNASGNLTLDRCRTDFASVLNCK